MGPDANQQGVLPPAFCRALRWALRKERTETAVTWRQRARRGVHTPGRAPAGGPSCKEEPRGGGCGQGPRAQRDRPGAARGGWVQPHRISCRGRRRKGPIPFSAFPNPGSQMLGARLRTAAPSFLQCTGWDAQGPPWLLRIWVNAAPRCRSVPSQHGKLPSDVEVGVKLCWTAPALPSHCQPPQSPSQTPRCLGDPDPLDICSQQPPSACSQHT